MIVTTPAERVRKIWAGWKPFPSSGLAATTGAPASPRETAGARTTTVFVELEWSHPAAQATASTSAPPTAAIRARAAAARESTGATVAATVAWFDDLAQAQRLSVSTCNACLFQT